jgi:hypothetical protein
MVWRSSAINRYDRSSMKLVVQVPLIVAAVMFGCAAHLFFAGSGRRPTHFDALGKRLKPMEPAQQLVEAPEVALDGRSEAFAAPDPGTPTARAGRSADRRSNFDRDSTRDIAISPHRSETRDDVRSVSDRDRGAPDLPTFSSPAPMSRSAGSAQLLDGGPGVPEGAISTHPGDFLCYQGSIASIVEPTPARPKLAESELVIRIDEQPDRFTDAADSVMDELQNPRRRVQVFTREEEVFRARWGWQAFDAARDALARAAQHSQ